MPNYWMKPEGTTEPPTALDNDWTDGLDLSRWPVMSGPAHSQRNPPPLETSDFLIFHAVKHARLIAAGQMLGPPEWDTSNPIWGRRFPWCFDVRVDVWVPLIDDAPKTSTVAPKRAFGAIQAGGPYASLSHSEYEEMRNALLAVPTVQVRDG